MPVVNYIQELCPLINDRRTMYVGYWHNELELDERFGVPDAISAHVYYQITTCTFIILDLTHSVARVRYMDKNVASPNRRLTALEKEVVLEYMGFEDGPVTLRDVFMSGIFASDLIVTIPFGNQANESQGS